MVRNTTSNQLKKQSDLRDSALASFVFHLTNRKKEIIGWIADVHAQNHTASVFSQQLKAVKLEGSY